MAMYGALHPKSDMDRLYIKRKEGGRCLMRVERCFREEEKRLGFCVLPILKKNSSEELL